MVTFYLQIAPNVPAFSNGPRPTNETESFIPPLMPAPPLSRGLLHATLQTGSAIPKVAVLGRSRFADLLVTGSNERKQHSSLLLLERKCQALRNLC